MGSNIWTVAEPGTIDVTDEVRVLEVGLVAGRVDVVAGEGPVRVDVHALTGRPLEVSVTRGTLKVGYRGAGTGFMDRLKKLGTNESTDVQITVPAEVALTFGVVKADGLVAGIRGDAKVSTISGPVVIDQCVGRLKASTVSGDLVVRDHEGPVEASSVSGALTVAGDVPEIKASTVSGDLTVDLTTTPREAKISGVSGNVVLRAPDAARLRLRLNAAMGRVTVDGDEHFAIHHKGISLDVGGHAAGTATINTVTGDLTVLSRTDAPLAEKD